MFEESKKHIDDAKFSRKKTLYQFMHHIIAKANSTFYEAELLMIGLLVGSSGKEGHFGSKTYAYIVAAEMFEQCKAPLGVDVNCLANSLEFQTEFIKKEVDVINAVHSMEQFPPIKDTVEYLFDDMGTKSPISHINPKSPNINKNNLFNTLVIIPLRKAGASVATRLLTLTIAFLKLMSEHSNETLTNLRKSALESLTKHDFFVPSKKITIESIIAYISKEFPKHGN